MLDRTIRGAALNWRKSSASNEDEDCVEVAATGRSVLVRDSHAASGDMLVLSAHEWFAFLKRIADGEMDRR